MFTFLVTIAFLIHFSGVSGLEVIPERVEIDYFNPKYIGYYNITVRKIGRHKPYVVNVDFNSLIQFGNNVIFDCLLLENLSGRFQPTLLRVTYKLCDFLNDDPFLGQLISRQLPKNVSCPFQAGEHHYKNLQISVSDNFPFVLPFTWASVMVKTRDDIEGYIIKNGKKITLLNFKIFSTIVQKPKKAS